MQLQIMHVLLVAFAMLPMNSHAKTIPGVAGNRTLTLGYLLSWSHEWAAGPYIGSSLVLGIEEVEKRQLLPGYDIDWILRDTWCQAGQGIKAATEVWFEANDLDALIGPGCSVVCVPVALLAAAWNIPVISYGCHSDLLSNKVTNPTFARTSGPYLAVANIAYKVIDLFEWNTVGIISDKLNVFISMAQQLETMLKASGKETFLYVAESTTAGVDRAEKIEKLRQILRIMKSSCRVMYVGMYSQDIRNLLAIAYEEDMLFDYVYLGAEAELPLGSELHYRPDLGLDIYEGVIDIEYSVPAGQAWDEFRQKVITSFQSPEFDGWEHVSLNDSVDLVNSYAGMIHDAVLLWAYGVNRTLEQGDTPDDGPKVLQNMINITFEGVSGTVVINEVGDRKSDYAVRMVQNSSDIPILTYDAAAGRFIKLHNPNQPADWSGLMWPGNFPDVPKDSPICGWQNEHCKVPSRARTITIAATVSTSLIFISLSVTAVYFFRKHRFEKRLQEAASCLISWSEVEERNVSNLCRSQTSIASLHTSRSAANKTQFCANVRHNTSIVAVKMFDNKYVKLTDRQVLLDLKQMRELNHENLNSFKGICLDASHECILMAYAPRGSLEDVIESFSSILTWDFKLSLATDIARGMSILHASEIGYHGHLKSSNCVVDSRWVCKITDYGLHSILRSGNKTKQKVEALLWTAPELLDQGVISLGTRKGDVFSYGIIVQEISLQSQPYGENEDITAEEIVSQVKMKSQPPYRPLIPEETCTPEWIGLMTSCWNDNPDARPSFNKILSELKKINGGTECTLVDSMIQRLEMHSTNLEVIVTQRSQELMDEKGKLEHLLQELLPKSIVDSLKIGRRVEPESFDSVTIFFSDVVSFTRISAAGTPMDVVKMLNLMYTLFDEISANFDVYKVATIGDAYFVASGVPLRNGNKHATEISDMGLQLLEAAAQLQIPHVPHETLRLRIGIHTGPCLAGVVGIKMPRYLLFGDTIDIASQMESKGETMKIHVSSYTAAILPHDKYMLQKREDLVQVKGHGDMTTHWLSTSIDD